jgi:polysaccharide pyruvyl transferase WcaK-like protein
LKILIKGYYGFGNLGDDLLLFISYRLIKNKFPDAEVYIFTNNTTNNPDAAHPADFHRYLYGLINPDVKLVDWQDKGHFDLILHGGGGTYFDNKAAGYLYNLLNCLLRLTPSAITAGLEKVIRIVINKPNIQQTGIRLGLGIGIGPFNSSSKHLAKATVELAGFKKLFVRDSLSLNTLKKITNKPEIELSTDISFLNNQWMTEALLLAPTVRGKIGIILKGMRHRYYDHYSGLINELKRKGYTPVVFAFDELFDRDMIETFADQCQVHVWQPEKDSMEDYIQQIKECELCLSDRAHGTLVATNLNIPNLIIKSSLKSMQVADMAGVLESISGVEMKRDYTVEDVEILQENIPEVKKALAELVKKRKALIESQANSIFAE